MKKFLLYITIFCLFAGGCFASPSHSDGKNFTTLYLKSVDGQEIMISSGDDNGWIEEVTSDHLCGGDNHGYLKDWAQFGEGYYRIWYYWEIDIRHAYNILKDKILVMELSDTSNWFCYSYLIIPKHAVVAIEYH